MPKSFEPSLDAERERGGVSKLRSSTTFASIGIFLLWWILAALVYCQTPSNFLRAESGWYLFLSRSAPAIQHDFEKDLLTKSFKGHYAPFGFLAEFMTAKLVGTHAGFWKWRQITVVALLATALFIFARNSAHALELSEPQASFSAIGLTAILIFQGQMRELVAWPFMILQLFWLLFTVIAGLSLVQMVRRPAEKGWPWVAAGAAYASLHFLGLGLATVAATALALAGIRCGSRHCASPGTPRTMLPLLAMIALTVVHAAVMLKFARPEAIATSPGWQTHSFLMTTLAFIPEFALAMLRSLTSVGQPAPEAIQATQHWPWGVAILAGFGFLGGLAFFRFRRAPTVRNRARFILQTFASVTFLTIIALTAARQWREPSPLGFADHLTGARYLIPGTFALAGLIIELFFLVAAAPVFLNAIFNIGLAVCAIAGNLHYATSVYPRVAPKAILSHGDAWQLIVAMANECRKRDLAIPNVPLGALTQEFHDWDLKLFEPLLRADLKAPPEASLRFVSWADFTAGLPHEYSREVPSLIKIQRQLQLETAK